MDKIKDLKERKITVGKRSSRRSDNSVKIRQFDDGQIPNESSESLSEEGESEDKVEEDKV